jgi:hypothetical protein
MQSESIDMLHCSAPPNYPTLPPRGHQFNPLHSGARLSPEYVSPPSASPAPFSPLSLVRDVGRFVRSDGTQSSNASSVQ